MSCRSPRACGRWTTCGAVPGRRTLANLADIADQARTALDAKNAARERALSLSREAIRTCANSIRAVHRGEYGRAREQLRGAHEAVDELRRSLGDQPDIYSSGYVQDCQKEFAEATIVLALISGGDMPGPDEVGVEFPPYLNGMGEAVGELRRHVLDEMRRGNLAHAEELLNQMDEVYYLLVTLDYPDAMTGGLRRTTDSVRGIIEKTRGELTTALRQEELRHAISQALAHLGQGNGSA